MKLTRTGDDGRTAVFSDGPLELALQEGLWPGGPEDEPLFTRAAPAPVFGPPGRPPRRRRTPCSAPWGTWPRPRLWAPLIRYLDLRELLRLPLDPAYAAGPGPRPPA